MQELINNTDEIKDPELDELLTEREKFRIEKEVQAKALVDKFSEDPKSAVTANISKNTLELINENDKFKNINGDYYFEGKDQNNYIKNHRKY